MLERHTVGRTVDSNGTTSPNTIGKEAIPELAGFSVAPSTMNFGSVPTGTTSRQTGTLTATRSSMTVSSAAWNGEGYSLSGITFPFTVLHGQSVRFIITFAPEGPGNHPGSISFFSDTLNSHITQALTGTGIQASQHDVSLSWDPSTSTVLGYNIYRGEQSGGPYAKLNSSPEPGTSFTDNMVQSGATYFYVATSIDATFAESTYSNEARVDIPPR
jgi:hypothetical protein